MISPVKRVGIVANIGKPAALDVARAAVSALQGRAEIEIQSYFAQMLGMLECAADDDALRACDVVLVFGGDGTVLATSNLFAPSCTPMLGVNLGRFGFLNEVAPEMIGQTVDHLLAGNFSIEERMMLEADVITSEGQVADHSIALNEVVVGHATLARVMHLSTSINGRYVTTYAADGIILASQPDRPRTRCQPAARWYIPSSA